MIRLVCGSGGLCWDINKDPVDVTESHWHPGFGLFFKTSRATGLSQFECSIGSVIAERS